MSMKFAPNDTRPLVRGFVQNEETKEKVDFLFNPKEITHDKQVPWKVHPNSELDEAELEFTAASPKTMSIEILFDTFEEKEVADRDVYKKVIKTLETFVMVSDDKKRPPMVCVTWGSSLPVFRGVIENMNVKYTLFLTDGTPCRATVGLKLKTAKKLMNKKEAEAANKKAATQKGRQTRQGEQMDRDTAAANNIDNPRSVPPGTTVTTPRGRA